MSNDTSSDTYTKVAHKKPFSAATIKILEALATGKPYELKAAWIQTTDLITGTGPDPLRAKKALEKLEFAPRRRPRKPLQRQRSQ